jgi:hypothetical protein
VSQNRNDATFPTRQDSNPTPKTLARGKSAQSVSKTRRSRSLRENPAQDREKGAMRFTPITRQSSSTSGTTTRRNPHVTRLRSSRVCLCSPMFRDLRTLSGWSAERLSSAASTYKWLRAERATEECLSAATFVRPCAPRKRRAELLCLPPQGTPGFHCRRLSIA